MRIRVKTAEGSPSDIRSAVTPLCLRNKRKLFARISRALRCVTSFRALHRGDIHRGHLRNVRDTQPRDKTRESPLFRPPSLTSPCGEPVNLAGPRHARGETGVRLRISARRIPIKKRTSRREKYKRGRFLRHHADRDRQCPSTYPAGYILLLSCAVTSVSPGADRPTP